LSFINLAHDTSIQVDFTNELGDIPENYQQYKQFLTGFVSHTQSPEYNLHEISKPNSGNYQIKITSNSNLPQYFKITIFTYDIDANLSNLTYEGIAGSQENPTILTIHYDKNGSSSLSSNANYELLLADIHNLFNQNKITKHYVLFELNKLTLAAINSQAENKLRYINAITSTINWFSNYIDDSAMEILSKRLWEIQNNLEN
jgi:hypothetical protein